MQHSLQEGLSCSTIPSHRIFAGGLIVILLAGCDSLVAEQKPAVGRQDYGGGPIEPGQKALLVPSTAKLDFGLVAKGGQYETTFCLHNPGPTPVEVEEVRTSCSCFRIVLEKTVVEPGEQVAATAKVDFTDDPGFVGNLRLDATGLTQWQVAIAFVIYADVKVRNIDRDY
jgi:hypothetical protein